MKGVAVALSLMVFVGVGVWAFTARDVTVNDDAHAEAVRMAQAFTESYGQEAASASAIQERESVTTNTNQHTMQATLHTNLGNVTLELFADKTPNTVENFVKLAKSGFYDGTKFHRVIQGFMIQGGDPLSKDDAMEARWGTGGPGYAFADEIGPDNHNNIGTIAMANSGPNTNGSQFFINVENNNFLDAKHTVFGRVIDGMGVVTKIENTRTGPNDRPVEPMIIESVTLGAE